MGSANLDFSPTDLPYTTSAKYLYYVKTIDSLLFFCIPFHQICYGHCCSAVALMLQRSDANSAIYTVRSVLDESELAYPRSAGDNTTHRSSKRG